MAYRCWKFWMILFFLLTFLGSPIIILLSFGCGFGYGWSDGYQEGWYGQIKTDEAKVSIVCLSYWVYQNELMQKNRKGDYNGVYEVLQH